MGTDESNTFFTSHPWRDEFTIAQKGGRGGGGGYDNEIVSVAIQEKEIQVNSLAKFIVPD